MSKRRRAKEAQEEAPVQVKKQKSSKASKAEKKKAQAMQEMKLKKEYSTNIDVAQKAIDNTNIEGFQGLLKASTVLRNGLGELLSTGANSTQVGNLDQKFVSTVGQAGVSVFKQMSKGPLLPMQLVEEIKKKFRTERDGDMTIDWAKIGQSSAQYLRVVHVVSFLHNAVQVARKERKVAQRRTKNVVTAPIESANNVSSAEEKKQITTARIARLTETVDKRFEDKGDFISFVIKPKSFTDTIQTLFDTAHLVKEGRVALNLSDEDSDDLKTPTIQSSIMPQSGEAPPVLQNIMKFDYATFRALIDAYELDEGLDEGDDME